MTRLQLSRRNLLVSVAIGAVSTVLPFAAGAQSVRRLVVAAESEPRSLNPALVASNDVFFIASKIVEPLAEASFEAPDGLSPRLAVSWSGSEDGLSVLFRLRGGVSWHDGKPFTSDDVAFSALNIWKPLQNLGRVVFKDLLDVETPDPLTAIFRFAKPTPFQLVCAALPALTAVVPKHIFGEGDIAANPANIAPIGTGPFRFAEHRPGEFYRLARNEDYWDKGEPKLDEIVYQVLPDRAAIAGAIERSDIQLAAFSMVPLAELERVSKVEGIAVVETGYEALTYQLVVEINHRRKELADLKVRRAIAHAIDRDYVVRTLFLNHAAVSTGPVPKNSAEFYSAEVPLYAYDVARANALLDEAGYRRDENGKRFTLRLLPAPYFSETVQFGDYLRQALAQIGIDAQLVQNNADGFRKAVGVDHDFDLAIAPPVYRGDPAISTTVLVRSGAPEGLPLSNQGGYVNTELDNLIDRAATTLDEQARVQLYKEFQRLVAEDLPLINVAEWTFITVSRWSVRNVSNNPRWAVSNWADTEIEV